MAVPATMLWNVLIAHKAMKQCKLRSIGISVAVELFDAILKGDVASTGETKDELRPLFKLQVLRAIGTVIVRRRRMYPTQEILLKHAVHMLHMANTVDKTEHVVDNVDAFLEELPNLTEAEQSKVVQVFLLTVILDGSVAKKERQLYQQVCDVCPSIEPHVSYVQYCAQRMRNIEPIWIEDLRQ